MWWDRIAIAFIAFLFLVVLFVVLVAVTFFVYHSEPPYLWYTLKYCLGLY